MSDVKGDDGRRRRGQRLAQASRRQILGAAHRLFVQQGYVATSVAAIAAEAGVAVQTIYNTVGSKRDVLGGVIELAVRGPNYPATPSQTVGDRIRVADEPQLIVELLVDWLAEAHARTAAISLAIREAAAVDPEAAELEQTLADERFSGYRGAARGRWGRRGGPPRGPRGGSSPPRGGLPGARGGPPGGGPGGGGSPPVSTQTRPPPPSGASAIPTPPATCVNGAAGASAATAAGSPTSSRQHSCALHRWPSQVALDQLRAAGGVDEPGTGSPGTTCRVAAGIWSIEGRAFSAER